MYYISWETKIYKNLPEALASLRGKAKGYRSLPKALTSLGVETKKENLDK